MKTLSQALNKVCIFVFMLISFTNYAQDSIYIRGIKYKVDTIIQKHDVGLGTMHTYYNLPDMPLLVNVLEVDYSNPFIKVETCLSNDTINDKERPTSMAQRKTKTGHTVFATVNGDFYNTQYPNAGTPVNGQILKGEVAKIPFYERGVICFTDKKAISIGRMTYQGNVFFKNNQYPINGVNKERYEDQLILYNSYNGKTTKTNKYGTEVVASLLSSKWIVNDTVKLKVDEIIDGKGSNVIPENKIILSGHAAAATFLKNLSVGDSISLLLGIKNNALAIDKNNYQEMIGGSRIILKDGKLTNEIWPQKHPRTAIGFSEDNKKLIMVVVDGRTQQSIGVGTQALAEILLLSGASTALNLDGGGSSVMMVRGKVTNHPSDGSERRVANALQIVSTAIPQDPITYKLNMSYLKASFGKTYKIGCSSFDANGEVVDYLNFDQVNYSVVGDIGKIEKDGTFSALGTAENGLIISSWNGIIDTVKVTIKKPSSFKFSINNLVIDNRNEYTFTVWGYDKNNTRYTIDNGFLEFKVLDKAIGSISNDGTFKGTQNGTTKVVVTASNVGLSDTCVVDVETGVNKILLDDFSDLSSWDISTKWISNISTNIETHPDLNKEMLRIDYSLKYNNKTSGISLKKNIDIFGMPDSLMLQSINSGYKASYYTILDHIYGLSKTKVYDDSLYTERYTVLKTNKFEQTDYRIPFKELRINMPKNSSYEVGKTYNGTFWIDKLYAVYPTKDPSVSVKTLKNKPSFKIYPNPASKIINVEANILKNKTAFVNVYDSNGRMIMNEKALFNEIGNIILNINGLKSGVYVINITSERTKLIKQFIVQ